MALVPCKECAASVADSAPSCPKCGVSNPGTSKGQLILTRLPRNAGAFSAAQITIDGEVVGDVGNGQTTIFDLDSGDHIVDVRWCGVSSSAVVRITDCHATHCELYITMLGILSGGMKLRPI